MTRETGGSAERWIKHYSSGHDILLVGEGDFSFSLCLGMAFGSAANIVATSLDSYDGLINKYKNASANVAILKALGASVLHGVDATQMKTLPDLRWKKFHRIIYNFPHAGFHGNEDNPHLIMMHRNLVRGFLWNASSMLWLDGEIHINHKIAAPFNRWRIEDLALECSLLCIGQVEFKIEDYPSYRNKRGSGSRPDKPFPLGACKTFMFKLYPAAEENGKYEIKKMGDLPSVMQYLSSETREQENVTSAPTSYNIKNDDQSESARWDNTPHQWQNGNHSTLSNQMKYLTISVPSLRDSSSLAHTSVNNKVKSSSAVFVKEYTPQNVYRREKIGIGSSSGRQGEEKQREEGPVTINCTVVALAPEGRWIKHYSSCHRILLVGEGDFSFSICLAAAFGWASNMVATSLDSEAFLVKNYDNALSNLVELSIRKCKVMHGIGNQI